MAQTMDLQPIRLSDRLPKFSGTMKQCILRFKRFSISVMVQNLIVMCI